jgi:peptidoglycan/xylan/chitin deacetylase (PgdA/CDA1 family)
VPVLCFHQLREFRADDGAYARTIITPPAVLTAQLEALRDGGYSTVPAPALVDHLQFGSPLPERPVLLTFDDGSATHHSVALPVLQRLGFVATFFPMTVVLDKPDWLSRDMVRELHRAGMTIGCHTYDHQRLDRLPADQWETQLTAPAAELAEIVGSPVDLIAYPFGVRSPEVLDRVTAAGFRAAFQLSDPQDPGRPLLTVRRVMPPPTWDGPTLLAHVQSDF